MLENACDLEIFLESLYIAKKQSKEYIFLDHFFSNMRDNQDVNVADLCYNILNSMKLIEIEKVC